MALWQHFCLLDEKNDDRWLVCIFLSFWIVFTLRLTAEGPAANADHFVSHINDQSASSMAQPSPPTSLAGRAVCIPERGDVETDEIALFPLGDEHVDGHKGTEEQKKRKVMAEKSVVPSRDGGECSARSTWESDRWMGKTEMVMMMVTMIFCITIDLATGNHFSFRYEFHSELCTESLPPCLVLCALLALRPKRKKGKGKDKENEQEAEEEIGRKLKRVHDDGISMI